MNEEQKAIKQKMDGFLLENKKMNEKTLSDCVAILMR